MNAHEGLRRAHLMAGTVVAAFVLLHLAMQLLAARDLTLHRAWTAWFRGFYRPAAYEAVLTGLIAMQIASGLVLSRVPRSNRTSRWQRRSGLYMAAFLVIHLAAVYMARLRGIETDLEFAAAGFKPGWGALFFAPYYFLAAVAAIVHIGCALERLLLRLGKRACPGMSISALVLGTVAAALIVVALSRVT